MFAGNLLVHYRWLEQDLRRQREGHFAKRHLRRRGGDLSFSRLLLNRLDAVAVSLPARGYELFHSRQWARF